MYLPKNEAERIAHDHYTAVRKRTGRTIARARAAVTAIIERDAPRTQEQALAAWHRLLWAWQALQEAEAESRMERHLARCAREDARAKGSDDE